MITELRRFTAPIMISQLAQAFVTSERFETESIGLSVDFDEARSVFEAFVRQYPNPSPQERASLDRMMAVPLHNAMRQLNRRTATDMHLWHWLCTTVFRDFVWYRWYGRIPNDFAMTVSPALAERFLGAPTLRGISRNALARLWWCAESLDSNSEGYDLVQIALSKQDFFQAVFEREFGLCLPVAKACLRALKDCTEDERREATKNLNHYFTTVAAETLSEPQVIGDLLKNYVHLT